MAKIKVVSGRTAANKKWHPPMLPDNSMPRDTVKLWEYKPTVTVEVSEGKKKEEEKEDEKPIFGSPTQMYRFQIRYNKK